MSPSYFIDLLVLSMHIPPFCFSTSYHVSNSLVTVEADATVVVEAPGL